MTLINSLRTKSSKFQSPFNYWIIDEPLSDNAIDEIYKTPIPSGDVIFDGTRAGDKNGKDLLSKLRVFIDQNNYTEFPNLKNLISEIKPFDIENLIVPYNKNIDDKHVFVAGLARSGSTILLNAIYDSNLFASSSYLDMPFILAPNLWKKLQKKNIDYNKFIERSHKDGVKISIKSPEAFEEVFWKTFEHAEDSKIKFERFQIDWAKARRTAAAAKLRGIY